MIQKKRIILIVFLLLVLALVAFFGGMLGKKTGKTVSETDEQGPRRCAYDGTIIAPLYQVDAYLSDGQTLSFCSIYCAVRWNETNKNQVVYFTVVDEVSGERMDSSLAHFVESDLVTVREVNNRMHAFFVKEDAIRHAEAFGGRLIENPLGTSFVLPEVARFDKLEIGTPLLPDSIPFRLAIFRPIFKENKLDVRTIPFQEEDEGVQLLSDGKVLGIVCDLPAALVLAKADPPMRIIKNVLRPNPYRPLFALVARPGLGYEDFLRKKGVRRIAVPENLSFQFYADYYLKSLDLPADTITLVKVENSALAWEMLLNGSVEASLLRTPYTDMAMGKEMTLLADDRNLPWMSVLVVHASLIDEKTEVLKRFIFGLEQSVLALNLKPDEFRTLLQEQGGIPKEARKRFPMPIFEGANCPAPDEIEPILAWLDQRGLLNRNTPYKEVVDSRFLPDPEDVGLAFCCR